MVRMNFVITFIIICVSHFMLDFMLGIWAVYKTIAHLDLVVAGLIASLGSFVGEGLQFFFGILSDRGHYQRLMGLGLGLTLTIPFLVYIDSSIILFIFLLSLYVGSGAFHPSALGPLVNYGTSNKSLFIAIFACSGMVGAGISQYTYVRLYYLMDGHTWVLAIPILILMLLCYYFPMPKIEEKLERSSWKEIKQEWRPRRFELGLLYGITVCLQIVVLSFSFLLPEILQRKGIEDWFCLGGGYFYFILGGVITSIPLGYCIDKWGYKLILGSIIVCSTLFLHLFLFLNSPSVLEVTILLILLGSTIGVIVPVIVAGANSLVPVHTSGAVTGIFMGGATCIAGFAPICASLLTKHVTDVPVVTLQLLSSLLILAMGLMYFMPAKGDEKGDEYAQI